MKNLEKKLTEKIKSRERKKKPRPEISGRSVFQIQTIKHKRASH